MSLATERADELDPESLTISACRDGTVFAGTYQVVRRIGSGGSGHVFEVEHLRLGKHFALKVLRNDTTSRKASQRFRREARAVARLRSEHIVSIVDCGELEGGTPYLVMELLEGEDLRRLLEREGALPARRAARIALDVCRGLSVVHAAGFVHRDLKPENLFVTRHTTGEDLCKVLDFGVVKMESSLSTTEGSIVGTVRYMAPEQLTDATTVGAPADIYAVGAILYECLLGRPLACGKTVHELMYGVMNATPKSLRKELPSLPASLAALVERCISKDAGKRPPSADYIASVLEQFLTRDVTPASSSHTTIEHVARPVAVNRDGATQRFRWANARLGFALIVGAGFGWLSHDATRGARQLPQGTSPPAARASGVVPAQAPPAAVAPAAIAPAAVASAAVTPIAPTAGSTSGSAKTLRATLPRRPPADTTVSSPRRSSGSNFDNSNPYQD